MNILLPVLTIKWSDFERANGTGIETVHVNAEAIGVGPRHVIRFYAAMTTEVVLRHPRIEGVCPDIGLAANQAKILRRHD